MNEAHVRTNIMFPAAVLDELKKLVPARERSAFVAEATRKQLLVLKQKAAIAKTAGAWSGDAYATLTTDDDLARYKAERDADWERHLKRVAEPPASYDVSPRQ